MKKKLFLIITGIVLVGTVCIWLLAKNKPAEQMLVDRLNESVSHYTDMNIKDDGAYSLKVSDTQMLVTTYMPDYIIYGVSIDEYTIRPSQIDETLTTEKEQDLPICNYNNMLVYDEKTDKFYNVKFEEKGSPAIPHFIEAKELAYELELPDTDAVEEISLKKNSDSPIVINSKDEGEYFIEQTGNGVYTFSKEAYDLIDNDIPYINYEPQEVK